MSIDDLHRYIQGIEEVVRSLREENDRLRNQVTALTDKSSCGCRAVQSNELHTDENMAIGIIQDSDINSFGVLVREAPVFAMKQTFIPPKKQPMPSGKALTARAKGGKPSHSVTEERNYRAVVRDKAQREAMDGFECSQCECFYKTTGRHLPTLCDKSSKHKYFKPPPATPAGFWDPWSQVDKGI